MNRKTKAAIIVGIILCVIGGVSSYFIINAGKEEGEAVKIAEEKIMDECVWERRGNRGVRRSK